MYHSTRNQKLFTNLLLAEIATCPNFCRNQKTPLLHEDALASCSRGHDLEHLRTVNGQVCASFQEVAERLHLLDDDLE